MLNFLFNKKTEAAELPFETDIHCHILPGIDDGSADIEESLELVRGMQDLGIRRIVASPHVTMETFENTPETVAPALDSLKKAMADEGIDMPLVNSAEYRLDENFLRHLESGILMPLPDNYLLVENSFLMEPMNIDDVIFDLQVRGFRPILAHPERYTYMHSRPSRYADLHEKGLVFQINLLSLAGYYGKAEKKVAEKLIEDDMVDFVGSDIHHPHHVQTIKEYLSTKAAHKHFEALRGRLLNDTLTL